MRMIATLALAMTSAPAAAVLPRPLASEIQVLLAADGGDTAWLLAVTLLLGGAAVAVLLAPDGRSAARQRLVTGLVAILSLLWVLIGYSLAFAPGGALIGGPALLALRNLADVRIDSAVPESTFALWEFAAALFVVAVATSAVLSRARSGWLLAVAPFWLLVAYVPLAHWSRGGGWLFSHGLLDAGGAASLHLAAGVAALVFGRFVSAQRGGGYAAVGPALVGTLAILAGSSLSASDDASTLLVSALCAGAAGALVWLAAGVSRGRDEAPDARLGALCGLVGVSAGAGSVGAVGAIALGAVAAGMVLAIVLLARRATASTITAGVHGGSAIVGLLLAPLFALPTLGGPGFVEGGPGVPHLLATQVLAVLVTLVWIGAATAIVALMVSAFARPALDHRAGETVKPPSGSDPRAA